VNSILLLGTGCRRGAQTQQRYRDGSKVSKDPFGPMALGKLLANAVMPHNKALQPTANPLCGLPAAELGR